MIQHSLILQCILILFGQNWLNMDIRHFHIIIYNTQPYLILRYSIAMPKNGQNQIRARIQASGSPAQIQQLCLSSINIKTISNNIKKLLQSCTELEYLTLNDCQITSLDNFPTLKKLIGLELSGNKINGSDLSKLCRSTQLNFLSLEGNCIASMSCMNQLKALPELQILVVKDNPITEDDNYREILFQKISSLKNIDCYDRDGDPIRDQDYSQYITVKERSGIDLMDFVEDEQSIKSGEAFKTDLTYFEDTDKKDDLPDRTLRGKDSIFMQSSLSNRLQFHSSLMFMRTGLNQDSDSQQEQSLIKDFKKKFRKTQ